MTNHETPTPGTATPGTAPEAPPPTRPLDSPWFWVGLFASVAAAALVAIGPKYQKREAQLESTFKMREHLARRDARQANDARGDEIAAESGDEMGDEMGESNSPSNKGGLLKTTGPLIWILVAAAAGSWIMLMRQRTTTART
jgi:hypothetical protein